MCIVDAFDTEQLLECMRTLISGQIVQVPIYDFKKHQRSSDSFRQVNSFGFFFGKLVSGNFPFEVLMFSDGDS